MAVHDVTVKDVILPSELRAAYPEQVAAPDRGKAKLESALAQLRRSYSVRSAADSPMETGTAHGT